ncbi:ATP-binding protein [Marinobacter panjinensis]|uniref:ATP-binding protein n=1 Tax=Marinobacter panjinensis TaxID=2576384 RepID=A0A4V6CTU5_9GAMM|nr:ATP-binding protein [Marinobacter panjinensis]MCR8916053.1 ATP-binding protein [Marinobacter panjinensis]TKV66985.1 ATP-binding protein [Marinobacter panjinensis]
MSTDQWLPNGADLGTDFKLRSLLQSGDGWQIFRTKGRSLVLVVDAALLDWWCSLALIEKDLFSALSIGGKDFFYLSSGADATIEPVSAGAGPQTKADALSFVYAWKETRKRLPDGSLQNSLFIERYSRLLPLTSEGSEIPDDELLGRWLTGGVNVSVSSFRRIHALCGWMSVRDLIDVVRSAGFEVPPGSELLDKPAALGSSNACLLGKDENKRNDGGIEDPLVPEINGNADIQRSFNLPGREALEDFFNEHVVDIIFNPERYRTMGIDFPSAIILHGPPGCGKTFAVDRLVEFIGWPSYAIDSNSVGSPYIHETSKKISELFDKALDNAPSVVVIDEMEAFLTDRRSGSSSGLHHVEEVAEFLRRIPEAISNRVLVIGMTNMIDMIDPAILRRGRFDHVIEVGMPSAEEIRSLLGSLLTGIPLSPGLAVEGFVKALVGRPLSDAAFFVREAARLAAKNGKAQLDDESLEAAFASLPQEKVTRATSIGFVWGEEKD